MANLVDNNNMAETQDTLESVNIFSSSVSPPPPSSSLAQPSKPKFYSAKDLPDELIQQITVYFEEELYIQGITLLSNLLALGRSPAEPIFVPPSDLLSFILTLSLHPRFTIHALTNEKLRVSTAATAYLTALLTTAGPISGHFADAYKFSNHEYMRGGRRKVAQKHFDSSDESNSETLDSDLAQAQGFFKRADDLWSAIGWAFTCSIMHPKRWESWTLWCWHMIDLLEQDWRLRALEESGKDDEWTRKTLLARYIGDCSGQKVKRMIRAIFADGSATEFTEIWKDETRSKRKKAPKLERPAKLDIEAGEFGDYGIHSSDEEETIPSDEEQEYEQELSQSTLGDSDALNYRARLLALLSSLAITDPESFTTLNTLYTGYRSYLRPLPLQTFHQFLTPRNLSYMSPDASSGLIQYLARSFLEQAAPACSMDELDWAIIEKHYAPWTSSGQTGASTVGDNGKLGVCIELLVSLARARSGFSPLRGLSFQQASNSSLWTTLEKGCARRRERAGTNVRRAKKGEAGAEFDFEEARDFEVAFLDGARMRLAMVLGMKIG